MITIAGGDSFVFGSELKYASKTFTSLLAFDHGEYICTAMPGFANGAISRTVIAECLKHKNPVVVVSWTFPGRYEFRFNFNTKNRTSPWYSLNSWTVINDVKEIQDTFINNNNGILKDFNDSTIEAKKSGLADFAKTFYQNVGQSEYWEIYVSLKEIVFLQNFLKQRNIPYLFTCADNSILYNYTIENSDEYIDSLYVQIDMSNWFWFPTGADKKPRGFYQWALENKYPVGVLHPLEQAHYDAFLLMKEKFNELVKKSLE